MVQSVETPLPTLLQSRAMVKEVKEDSKEPVPQVLGASLSPVADEEALHEEVPDASPLPSFHVKCEDDLLKEEAFWTKAQEALDERGRREKLLQFLREHHFKDVNSSTGWFFNYHFPLHVAVEQNDAAMVSLLLHFKAKKKLKDATGRTARQLAHIKNTSGSHDKVLMVFMEHTAARKMRAAARRAARMEREKKAAGEVLEEPDLEMGFKGGAAFTEVTEEVQPETAERSPEGI